MNINMLYDKEKKHMLEHKKIERKLCACGRRQEESSYDTTQGESPCVRTDEESHVLQHKKKGPVGEDMQKISYDRTQEESPLL